MIGFVFLQNIVSAQVKDTLNPLNRYLQIKNPEGTDFWLCFMKNFKEPENNSAGNELLLELFITSDDTANVTVEIENINFKQRMLIPARTIKSIKIDPKAQIISSDRIEKKAGIHIISDNPVSVYGLNRRFQTTDTYLGLPVRVLGNSYRAICYSVADGLMAEFSIVGTEDSTEITIIPVVNTQIFPADEPNKLSHKANIPYKVIINKGDVYQVAARFEQASRCDLTGTLVKANKNIAFFSGHQCAYVPPKIIACNHLVEQIPPIHSWGKHFYIGNFRSRSQYTYRVLANEDSTRVFEETKLVKVLRAGEFLERNVSKNIQIAADKPVLVAQYSQGFRNGDSVGDPMMILVSPTQQFLRKYRFATPINGEWGHYVNVVVPTISIGSMKLDNKTVDTSQFTTLGLSRYSIAYLKVPFGTHIIEGALPFGMYSYGFGYGYDSFDAYGTMGGQSFVEYEPIKDTLPPMAEAQDEAKDMKIIFRDDRVDDSGIKFVKILDAEGIDASIPKFEEGIPQLPITIKPYVLNEQGKIILEATDLSLNKSVFTVCYYFNEKKGKYLFSLSDGERSDCLTEPGIQVGIFGKVSLFFHSPDFSSSGNVVAMGKFSGTIGTGGYAGIYIGRKVLYNLTLSARISFEKYGGTINAPDSSISHIRDESTGSLIPYQEAREVKFNASFIHLGFAGEWYLKKYFYLTGGANFAFNLSDNISFKKKILIPEGYVYQNGGRDTIPANAPTSLGSISFLRLGLFGGVGFTYAVNYRISAFAEGTYMYHIGNLINDGKWSLNQISFIAGFKIVL